MPGIHPHLGFSLYCFLLMETEDSFCSLRSECQASWLTSGSSLESYPSQGQAIVGLSPACHGTLVSSHVQDYILTTRGHLLTECGGVGGLGE